MGKVIKSDKFGYKKTDKFVKEFMEQSETLEIPFILVVYEQQDGLHYQFRLSPSENTKHFSLGSLVGILEHIKLAVLNLWTAFDEEEDD